MISVCSKSIGFEKCSKCSSCLISCPVKAIYLETNSLGFPTPVIDAKKCIGCNLCQLLCPHITLPTRNVPKKIVYGYVNEPLERKRASSGGAFGLIAKRLIMEGFDVIGAAWTDDLKVEHIVITSEADLPRLYKSKYLLSDISNIYSYLEKTLPQGRKVCFSGTPCQVAAIKNKFFRYIDQLVFVDILCHGCPTYEIFNGFIDSFEKENKLKIVEFTFRSKAGNHPYTVLAKIQKGNRTFEKSYRPEFFPYMAAYRTYKIFMPCCYSCKYATKERVGDLTIADAWSINNVDSRFKTFGRNGGVSLIMANTDNGIRILKDILPNMTYGVTDSDFVAKTNGSYISPACVPEKDLEELRVALRTDFNRTIHKHFYLSKTGRLKLCVSPLIPNFVKRPLKAIRQKIRKR